MAALLRTRHHSPVYTAVNESTASVGAYVPAAGYTVVLIDAGSYTSTTQHLTAIEGLGASWSKLAGGTTTPFQVWIGTGATASFEERLIVGTGPTLAPGQGRRLLAYVFSGAQDQVSVRFTETADKAVSPAHYADNGQEVLALGYSDTADSAVDEDELRPGTLWDWHMPYTSLTLNGVDRAMNITRRGTDGQGWYVPNQSYVTARADHRTTAYFYGGTAVAMTLVVGVAEPNVPAPTPFVRGFTAGTPVPLSVTPQVSIPATETRDLVVVFEVADYTMGVQPLAGLTGLGGNWERANTNYSGWTLKVWVCKNPVPSTEARTVSGLGGQRVDSDGIRRVLHAFVLTGVSQVTEIGSGSPTGGGQPGSDGMLIAAVSSNNAENSIAGLRPPTGWSVTENLTVAPTREPGHIQYAYIPHTPTWYENYNVTVNRYGNDAGGTFVNAIKVHGGPLPEIPPYVPPETTGAGISVFNGTTWTTAPVKVFNGTTWTTAAVKRFNGTTWV